MQVKEAMCKEAIAVHRATPLRSLLGKYKHFHGHPIIPVVDDSKYLIGVVNSENLLDILRPQKTNLFRNLPLVNAADDVFDLEYIPAMGQLIIVDDIMEAKYVSVNEDDDIGEAFRLMKLSKTDKLPVVDKEGKISGIIGIFDIIWRMFQAKGVV